MGTYKRIAFLLPRFGGGGAERVSVAIARSLRAYDYETEIWATRFDPGVRTDLENSGISTTSARDTAGKVRHISRANMEKVAEMVLERHIDILVVAVSALCDMCDFKRLIWPCRLVFHLHGQPFWELLPFTTAKGKPGSLREYLSRGFSFLQKDLKEHLFKTYTRRAKRYYSETYAAADAYVVLCEGYSRELANRLGLSDADSKIRAIYNPVADLEALMQLSHTEKGREVLFVGRLTRNDKRVDRLLRAWSMAAKPDWTLRIVGDGPDRGNLERLAQSLRLENVVFEGYRKPDEFFAAAQIVAMTSTFEGWPGCLVEGLAAGCIPIAFGCSAGVKEILSDGRGIEAEPFNEDEFAKKLAALMEQYPLKASEHTRQWLQGFGDSNIAAHWHQLFQSLQVK